MRYKYNNIWSKWLSSIEASDLAVSSIQKFVNLNPGFVLSDDTYMLKVGNIVHLQVSIEKETGNLGARETLGNLITSLPYRPIITNVNVSSASVYNFKGSAYGYIGTDGGIVVNNELNIACNLVVFNIAYVCK